MGMGTQRWSRIAAYTLLGLITAFFLARTVIPTSGKLTAGFMAYFVAGQTVRDREPATRLYDDAWFAAQVSKDTRGTVTDIYLANPPALAVAWAPLAYLSVATARRVWIAVSFLCLALSLWWIARELGWSRQPWALVAMSGLVLLAAPTREQFGYGQMYVFLLFIHVLGWRAYVKRRDARAGIALGVAMVLKVSGWPIGVLMLAQRRWSAVTWVIATAAAIALFSLPWVGLESWWLFLTDAIPRTLQRGAAALTAYQDTTSFWQHLFRYVPTSNPAPVLDAPRLATVLTLGTTLGALAALLVPRRTASVSFAAAVALSELLSPVAEQYHYVVLVLPLAVLWHQACMTRDRLMGVCACLATLLIAMPVNYKAPHPVWSLLCNYPRLIGGWIAFAGLAFTQASTNAVTSGGAVPASAARSGWNRVATKNG
jgi:hypothetical protein